MQPTSAYAYALALYALALVTVVGGLPSVGRADDQLLKETVEFTGAVTFLGHRVPALIIGAVRNGERAISGFGKIATNQMPARMAKRFSGSARSPNPSRALSLPQRSRLPASR